MRKIKKIKGKTLISKNQSKMVDLGFPSGLKWAKCNLGAETETGYGNYFMFGSTTPDTNNVCSWANAPFNDGLGSFNSSYFTAHKDEWFNGDITKPEYDAATQIIRPLLWLLGAWRFLRKLTYYNLRIHIIFPCHSICLTGYFFICLT